MISNIQFFAVLIMGACIGGIAGYIGSLMVTKRMALMGGALGHLTLPGVSLGLLYGFDISLGALLFLGGGIFLIWLLEQRTKLPLEALTAVVFASSLAIAFLFLPEKEAYIALIGNISNIPFFAIISSVLISLIIFFIVRTIMPRLVLAGISSDLACMEGYNVSRLTLVYLVCIALVVAMGVRIVGGLMTAALVSIPACTSNNISKNLSRYCYASTLFGILSCIIGMSISLIVEIPAGPLIIITSSLFFLISLVFK
ncbi:metal ABC transporter permease [Candidatus Dependentiae bacterium]|nr:MAG: metal ABC transporter permease [Candidatus Dependentiae bacterium]